MNNNAQQALQDLAMSEQCQVIIKFDPKMWLSSDYRVRQWNAVEFPPNPRNLIPKCPGVYAFVVDPSMFDFPSATGLLYVGKATSFYSRISSYIREVDRDLKVSKRPAVWKMVNMWNGCLKYFYTETKDVTEAEALEQEMLAAFDPPFNKQHAATVSQFNRAFTI